MVGSLAKPYLKMRAAVLSSTPILFANQPARLPAAAGTKKRNRTIAAGQRSTGIKPAAQRIVKNISHERRPGRRF